MEKACKISDEKKEHAHDFILKAYIKTVDIVRDHADSFKANRFHPVRLFISL